MNICYSIISIQWCTKQFKAKHSAMHNGWPKWCPVWDVFLYYVTLIQSSTEVPQPPQKSSQEFVRFPEHNEDTVWLWGGGRTPCHNKMCDSGRS